MPIPYSPKFSQAIISQKLTDREYFIHEIVT